jgi:hypothetical protein
VGCGPLKKRDGSNLLDQNGDPQYPIYRGTAGEDDVDVASQGWGNVTAYVLDAAGMSKVKYDGTPSRFPGTSLQRCGY